MLQTQVQLVSVPGRRPEQRNSATPLFPSPRVTRHPGRGAVPLISRASLRPVLASTPKIRCRLRSSEFVLPSTQQPVSTHCPASADYKHAAGPILGSLGIQSSLHGAACTKSRASEDFQEVLGGPEQGGDPEGGARGCTTLNLSHPLLPTNILLL